MKVQNSPNHLLEQYAQNPSATLKSLRTKHEAAGEMGAAMGKSASDSKTNLVDEMSYQQILCKLRSGHDLSSCELAILKKRNPGLYTKALQAKRARQELRQQLSRAKNSKEFERAKSDITVMAASAACAPPDKAAAYIDPMHALEDVRTAVSNALHNEFDSFKAKHNRLLANERYQKRLEEVRQAEKQNKKKQLKKGI